MELHQKYQGTNSRYQRNMSDMVPMDQMDTSTSSRTNECSQASEDAHKFGVFLSHSGKQKNFVRQLYRDLTNQGVSCFFDQDPESLPVGEEFPPHIFEATTTCKVAVLLLSVEFLESKWPMNELSAFVEAKHETRTNPNLKILPLFFKISPDDLKNITADNAKWTKLETSEERRGKWEKALKAVRRINGLPFAEGGDEVKFRDEIVKEILRILPPPPPRYHVHGMQGEARMCQELANFFSRVQPNKDGIKIAGLYGIAGQGKTTLGKAFCNFKQGEFEGKICHLEFSRGHALEDMKLALNCLTQCPESHLQTLREKDQAKVELDRTGKGKRVLLVLDNVTEESREEVMYYLDAEWGENSWILLTARSVDVLEKHFYVDSRSCMRVPRLKEEEAIHILLERASVGESTLGAENRGLALKCARRCLFKERIETFHPLALKAFGGYLFTKYHLNLSKWVDEVDGLDDVFHLLSQAFDVMLSESRTIFMLLTVYKLPNMSPDKVTEWMAIICNKEESDIKKAVDDLRLKAFIEEIDPEIRKIRIHDLYIEFAQSKAKEMGRWLWWKGTQHSTRGLISQDNAGFELAKLEGCVYRRIAPKHLGKLSMLQLIEVQNMSKLDLSPMDSLRSVTLSYCKELEALDGIENLLNLAWLQIREVHPMFKLPELSSLQDLQHIEIDIAVSRGLNQLGGLTKCLYLREINVRCPSLSEFPKVNGLQYLKKVQFNLCDKVRAPLDCRGCVELQSIVLDSCPQMVASPILTGCNELSNILLRECDAVPSCPDIDVPSSLKTLELLTLPKASSSPKNLEFCDELEILKLRNMGELTELPSFRRLSKLTVLVLYECGMTKLPDLACCAMLKDVYFSNLKNLVRFPNFSVLRELERLRLKECTGVQDPPDISGCHKMGVLHLVHNDNMEGLPNITGLSQLREIKLSWLSEDKVRYEAIGPESLKVDGNGESPLGRYKYEDLQKLTGVRLPEAFMKELQWLKGKIVLLKFYFRGVKFSYSIKTPCQQKIVVRVDMDCENFKRKLLKAVAGLKEVESVAANMKENKLTVIGETDTQSVVSRLKKFKKQVELVSVGPANKETKTKYIRDLSEPGV